MTESAFCQWEISCTNKHIMCVTAVRLRNECEGDRSFFSVCSPLLADRWTTPWPTRMKRRNVFETFSRSWPEMWVHDVHVWILNVVLPVQSLLKLMFFSLKWPPKGLVCIIWGGGLWLWLLWMWLQAAGTAAYSFSISLKFEDQTAKCAGRCS